LTPTPVCHHVYIDGYYDRLNEGLWDLLQHENHLTREVIERYAQKHQLCPFELSLDANPSRHDHLCWWGE
ncbi:hypothetical protein OCL90_14785, partial [Enterococcus faecalis]|uniref:hypothetical protein n=1 Tax=Enterococcus faecalis TaxID=1351 RepID=UPI0022A75194